MQGIIPSKPQEQIYSLKSGLRGTGTTALSLTLASLFRGYDLLVFWDFPGGSVVKNPPAMQEMWVWSLGGGALLEKEMATHSSLLAGKSYGQRSLAGYSSWGHKRIGRDFSD